METRLRRTSTGVGLEHAPDDIVECILRQLIKLIEVDRKYATL
jgi:hypothetical protein